MKHLDLFTGIGGFSLAAERAGMTTVGHSEIDKHASACLERRWPDVPNLGDVTLIEGITDVDIITAGSPCQDYSVAGKRAGTAGARSGLIVHTFRLVEETQAEWLVIENVPGLLSSNGGRDMGAVLGTLADLGMGFAWRVLDAQAFGVPQRRRRIFIVGRAGGCSDGPREVLSVGPGLPRDTPPSSQARKDDPARAAASAGVPGVAGTLASRERGGGFPGTDEAVAGYVVAENQRAEIRAMDCLGALAASPSGKPGQRSPTIAVHTTQDPIVSNDQMHCLSAKESGAVLAPDRVRKLTPLECERLQGFPDGWTEGVSDTQRYRQLGNAVAVPVAEWVLSRIGNQSPFE